jgi:hypothetical protein
MKRTMKINREDDIVVAFHYSLIGIMTIPNSPYDPIFENNFNLKNIDFIGKRKREIKLERVFIIPPISN